MNARRGAARRTLPPLVAATLVLVAGCRRPTDPSPPTGTSMTATPMTATPMTATPMTATPMPNTPAPATIELDLEALDGDGLRGPPDGKVAVAYEFAIPDTPEARAVVQGIDPTVEFHPGSRGRIGAGPGTCLCIGSTHQPRHRDVLAALSRLPGVTRIIECHRE